MSTKYNKKHIQKQSNRLFSIAAGWPVVAVVLALSFMVARCGTQETSIEQGSVLNLKAETLVLAQQTANVDLTDWLKVAVLENADLESFAIRRAPRVEKVLLTQGGREFTRTNSADDELQQFIVRPEQMGVVEMLVAPSHDARFAQTKLLRMVIVPGTSKTMGGNNKAVELYGPTRTVKNAHVLYTLQAGSAGSGAITSFSGSVGIAWPEGASVKGDSSCCQQVEGETSCQMDNSVDVCLPLPFTTSATHSFINSNTRTARYNSGGRVPLPHQMFVLVPDKANSGDAEFQVQLARPSQKTTSIDVDVHDFVYLADRFYKKGQVLAPSFFRVASSAVLDLGTGRVDMTPITGDRSRSDNSRGDGSRGDNSRGDRSRGIRLSWQCPPGNLSISDGGSTIGSLQHKVPFCSNKGSAEAKPWLPFDDGVGRPSADDSSIYVPIAGYKIERCTCSTDACANECRSDNAAEWKVLTTAVGSDIKRLDTPQKGLVYSGADCEAGKLCYFNKIEDSVASDNGDQAYAAMDANSYYRYRVLAVNQALASSAPKVAECDTSVPGNTSENGPCFDLNDGDVVGIAPATPDNPGSGNGRDGGRDNEPAGDITLTLSMESNPTCSGNDYDASGFVVPEGCTGRFKLSLAHSSDSTWTGFSTDLKVRVRTEDGSAKRRVAGVSVTTTTQSGVSQSGDGTQQGASSSATVSGTVAARKGDYIGFDKVITLPAGTRVGRFPLEALVDKDVEAREDLLLHVQPVVVKAGATSGAKSGASLASRVTTRIARGSGYIQENSQYITLVDKGRMLQTLSLEGPPENSVVEGGPATFTISLKQGAQEVPAQQDIYVLVKTIDGTAKGSDRYSEYNCGEDESCGVYDYRSFHDDYCVHLSPGQSQKRVSIPIYKDSIAERGEVFHVEISKPRTREQRVARNRVKVADESTSEKASSNFKTVCGYYGSSSVPTWPESLGLSNNDRATATIHDKLEATSDNLLIGFFDDDGYKKSYSMREPADPIVTPMAALNPPVVVRLKKTIPVPLTLSWGIWESEHANAQRGLDWEYKANEKSKAQRVFTIAAGESVSPPISVNIKADDLVEGSEDIYMHVSADAANCRKMYDYGLIPRSYCRYGSHFNLYSPAITIHDGDSTTLELVKNIHGDRLSGAETVNIAEDALSCDWQQRGGRWQQSRLNAKLSDLNTQKCLFVRVRPSDNVTSNRELRFRILASPLHSGDVRAGMGSDYEGEFSNRIIYSPSSCPNNICPVDIGRGGRDIFRILSDNLIERNEKMRVKIQVVGNAENVDITQPAGRILTIENDDFAIVKTQYARTTTGGSCKDHPDNSGITDYKDFDSDQDGVEMVDIFQASRLCLKMTCQRGLQRNLINDKIMSKPLHVAVSGGGYTVNYQNKDGEPAGGTAATWNNESDCSYDDKLAYEKNAEGKNKTSPNNNQATRYVAIDIPSGASGSFTLEALTDATGAGVPGLHSEQTRYNRQAHFNCQGGSKIREGFFVPTICRRGKIIAGASRYSKQINIKEGGVEGSPKMEFVYRGSTPAVLASSQTLQDGANTACVGVSGSSNNGGHSGSAAAPYVITEPAKDTQPVQATFACFKGKYLGAGSDDFSTSSGVDCGNIPALNFNVKPVSWSAANHKPVIYGGNPPRAEPRVFDDFQSVPSEGSPPDYAGLPVLRAHSFSGWSEASGDGCKSTAVAAVQIPYNGREDVQARGFKVQFSGTSRDGANAVTADQDVHFYIAKNSDDPEAPTNRVVRLAYLGYTKGDNKCGVREALGDPKIPSVPPLPSQLAAAVAGEDANPAVLKTRANTEAEKEYACFQAVLQDEDVNYNLDDVWNNDTNLVAANQDLALTFDLSFRVSDNAYTEAAADDVGIPKIVHQREDDEGGAAVRLESISGLKIKSGQKRSQIISVPIEATVFGSRADEHQDRMFQVVLDQGTGWQNISPSTSVDASSNTYKVAITNLELRKPALALKALALVKPKGNSPTDDVIKAAEACQQVGDNTLLKAEASDTGDYDTAAHTVVKLSANDGDGTLSCDSAQGVALSGRGRNCKAKVEEGEFICMQAVYLRYDADGYDNGNAEDPSSTPQPLANDGSNNSNGSPGCYLPRKSGNTGGCWVQISPQGKGGNDSLTNITLVDQKMFKTDDQGNFVLDADNNKIPVANPAGAIGATSFSATNNAHDFTLPEVATLANDKSLSPIFAIQVHKNKDQRVVGKDHEVFQLALTHVDMNANNNDLIFLPDTAFTAKIPYCDETGSDKCAPNSEDPGYDGGTNPKPVIVSHTLETTGGAGPQKPIVQFKFKGQSSLSDVNDDKTQNKYIVQRCELGDGGGSAPSTPNSDNACWKTLNDNNNNNPQKGSGPTCGTITTADPTAADNLGKLKQTSTSSAPYTFTCAVEAKTDKYYFFRVRDMGSSGDADDSAWTVSKVVSLSSRPDHAKNLKVRKVTQTNGFDAIELSWACPDANKRQWSCKQETSGTPDNLIMTAVDAADPDEIIDYHVYRCKMRDNDRDGNYKDSVAPNYITNNADSLENTYNVADDMPCVKLNTSTFDGFDLTQPEHKSTLMSLSWKKRISGSFGDDDNAAAKASVAPSGNGPLSGVDFKTQGNRIIFTDKLKLADYPLTDNYPYGTTPPREGRYKYRIKVVTKYAQSKAAYCSGITDVPSEAGMLTNAEGVLNNAVPEDCAPSQSQNDPYGIGNGLPIAAPAPTGVQAARVSNTTKVKLIWQGTAPLISTNDNNTPNDFDDDTYKHVYHIRYCQKENANENCVDNDFTHTVHCDTLGEGKKVSSDVFTAPPNVENNNKVISTNVLSGSQFQFACVMTELSAGKYYRFRVAQTENLDSSPDVGEGASSLWSEASAEVQVPAIEVKARKADVNGTAGIELSWPCPEDADRHWECETDADPEALSITSDNKDDSQTSDIIAYKVWRCKMRDVNKNSIWYDTLKSGRHTSGRDISSGGTYNAEDDMHCEDLATWPNPDTAQWPDLTDPPTPSSLSGVPRYDGYTVNVPAEKAHIEKLVWGDRRFAEVPSAGPYADGTTNLDLAVSVVSATDTPQSNTTFKTANGRVIFTDTSGITAGRYKYRVQAVAKNDVYNTYFYCDGTGDPTTPAGMQTRLTDTVEPCTTMTVMRKAPNLHIPLGLVVKAPVAPSDLTVTSPSSGKLRLEWLGSEKIVAMPIPDATKRHLYAIQACELNNGNDTCADTEWKRVCGDRNNDSGRGKTTVVANADFSTHATTDEVFSTNEKSSDQYKFACIVSKLGAWSPTNLDPNKYYRFRIGQKETYNQDQRAPGESNSGESSLEWIGHGAASAWSSVTDAKTPSGGGGGNTPSFAHSIGTVHAQQNTNDKVVLSWACPSAADRDWDCDAGTTVGISGNDAGFLLDTGKTNEEQARDNASKVGRYQVYRCEQGAADSGTDFTRCTDNENWFTDSDTKSAAKTAGWLRESFKVSILVDSQDANNNKIQFIDNHEAWRSSTDTSSEHGAVAEKKYVYKIVVQNEAGSDTASAQQKTCRGPALLTDAATDCEDANGTGLSLRTAFAIYNLKIKKDSSDKIVLSWDCPLAHHRGIGVNDEPWVCEPGMTPQYAGLYLGGYGKTNAARAVAFYNVSRCQIEDGATDLGRCMSSVFYTNRIGRAGISKLSFEAGSPGRVKFVDHNVWEVSGSDPQSYFNPEAGKKYAYGLEVNSGDGLGKTYMGPACSSVSAPLSTDDQVCSTSDSDTGITAP